MSKKVLVALSGGVDSAAAALLARRAGYEVEGMTLLLAPADDGSAARAAAEFLGIPLRIVDAAARFQASVIEPAARVCAAGRTPNPCCECNERLKFALLAETAEQCGADFIATGHYARLGTPDGAGAPPIRRGADRAKDQSYFLYRLPAAIRERLIFPLGDFTKPEVRAMMKEAGWSGWERPDSQDTCFAVPGECCGDTLFRRCGFAPRPGRFLYRGREVGRHAGIHRHTLGQRQGLGVALGVPAYIRSIDAASGDIELVTDSRELEASHFTLLRAVWSAATPPAEEKDLTVQLRYRGRPVAAKLFAENDGWRVETAQPQRAITPGQAAVFYDGDTVVGGGEIGEVTR